MTLASKQLECPRPQHVIVHHPKMKFGGNGQQCPAVCYFQEACSLSCDLRGSIILNQVRIMFHLLPVLAAGNLQEKLKRSAAAGKKGESSSCQPVPCLDGPRGRVWDAVAEVARDICLAFFDSLVVRSFPCVIYLLAMDGKSNMDCDCAKTQRSRVEVKRELQRTC